MITAEIKGVPLTFETDPELFSPNFIDAGTLAMLGAADFSRGDKVLDLGCGYGTVGILAAKITGCENVVMCDVSEKAVNCSKINARLNGVPDIDIRVSDGYGNIPEDGFTLILSNPPYHSDFSVAKKFIEGGYKRLVTGGKMVMVTKRLAWYKNKLSAVFGGVRVLELGGYYVFIAEKRDKRPAPEKSGANTLSKKLRRKYEKARFSRRKEIAEK